MRVALLLTLSLLFIIGCAKGYKEGQPLTGEDLALANQVSDLSKKLDGIDQTAPSSLGPAWKALLDNMRLFDNNCQRKSCNSLEARDNFNHVRYYSVQLDSVITQKGNPQLVPTWKTIRKEIDEIGKKLGYHIEQ